VQAAAGGYHGKNGDLAVSDDLQKGRAILLNQPLQLLLNLGWLEATVSGHAHSLGEGNEVGVLLVGVRVAILVEEVLPKPRSAGKSKNIKHDNLPLGNHALLLVVKQEDLDTNVELSSGGELSKSHVERSVTVNIDDQAVRAGHLSSQGRGKTVTHGTETTGGDHGTRVTPAEVLGSPHLVLTDTSGDDGLILHVGREVAQLLNNGLGLDGTLLGLAVVERQGEALLPVIDLLEPLRTLGNGLDLGQKKAKVISTVTLNGLVGLNNLVDVLGHDLKVHDTTTALSSSKLGLRGELGDAESHTVIETSTNSNDQIRLLHSHVGIGGSVHAQHVKGLRVQLIETTKTLEGCGNGNACLVGELLQNLGTIGASKETLSNVEDGLLSDVNKVGNTVNGTLELLLAHFTGSQGSRAGERGDGAVHRDGVPENASSDILRQVNQDGSGTTTGSDLEGLLDAARQLTNGLDHHVPLGAGARDTDDISFLERIGSNCTSGDLTTEHNHRGTIGHGILHGSNDISSTGAGGYENNTGLARGTSVALSHVTGTLFMLGKEEFEVLRVVDGIEHGENSTTGVTDYITSIRIGLLCNIMHRVLTDVLHTLAKHHLVEDFSTAHSNHSLYQSISSGVSKS